MRSLTHTLTRNLLLAFFLFVASAIVGRYLASALYTMRLVAAPAPGMLEMPVAKVRAASLRNSWQVARDGGRRRHEGIDIFAPRGTPVLASSDGIVMRIGTNALGGKVVWLMGPGGQRHYYAHLDRFAWLHTGMRVETGTVLGYVGNTGNAAGTPPHLHYGIYTAAGAINPYPLLRAGA